MKFINKFINEPFAKTIANIMMLICYLLILLFTSGLVLSFIGRQTFILQTSTGIYNSAIYNETNRDWTYRGPTVSLSDEINVTAGANGQEIDLITHVGLFAMYAITMAPLIVCFWFLSRVFYNISKGVVFTEKNAIYLLYYSLIRIGVAIFVPFIKLFIAYLANQFTHSKIYIATGQNLLNDLIPNIAILVAAYIIHYGVHLQDEVDHTL